MTSDTELRPLAHDAAAIAEIARLKAENDRFRAALEVIAARPTHEGGCYYNNRFSVLEAREVLRASLAQSKGEE